MRRVCEVIKAEYKKGDLSFSDAINELVKAGYSHIEARQIISEWDAE